MSFFKELKEDIVQSVNELSDTLEEKVTASEETVVDDETLETEVRKEIDSILEDGILNDMSVTEETSKNVSESEESSEPDLSAEMQGEQDETKEGMTDISEPAREPQEEKQQEDSYFDKVDHQEVNETMNISQEEDNMSDFEETVEDNSEETTVITKGTTISGGIKSDTSLIVKGVIEGDVECQGKLTITGHVANSTASEIYVNTPRLEGSLNSQGSVKIDVSTVVIGSITSASVVVAGAVKGDIDVNGPVIIDSTAVVKGSVFAKSIQINSGAVIDGNCSLKYADVDLDTFFD